jgi:hypothetical protein
MNQGTSGERNTRGPPSLGTGEPAGAFGFPDAKGALC